jgi:putative Ig domain-containing protein
VAPRPRSGLCRRDPARLNDDLRIVQVACGVSGLGSAVFGAVADALPLYYKADKTPWGVDFGVGLCTTVLGSAMFGAVSSCPPITGTDWDAADGHWSVAFDIAALSVFASFGALAISLYNKIKDVPKDTSILRNVKEAVWGPILSTFLGIGYLIPSGQACTKDGTNPYTTAMILLSGVSSGTQIARIGLRKGPPLDMIRGGVITAVNATATGVSASMLTAAAGLAYANIGEFQAFPDGKVGQPYEAKVKAGGGDHVFNQPLKAFTLVSGKLPDGLTLDAATGMISGTPTRSQLSVFKQCTDSYGPPQYSKVTELQIAIFR